MSGKLITKLGKVRNNGKKENQALIWEPTPAKTHSLDFPKSANHTSEKELFLV